MTTTEWLAFWAIIISAATLLTYLGQLTVLILVYRRVIKETDRNAEIRRQEIEKAGDMMQEQSKDLVRRMNEIARRNTFGMALMGICLTVLVFINRGAIRKFEENNTKSRGDKVQPWGDLNERQQIVPVIGL